MKPHGIWVSCGDWWSEPDEDGKFYLRDEVDEEMAKLRAENERLRAEASEERAESARLLVAYRSESATVYKLREQIEELRYRVATIASEAFGPFPTQTADEALTAIEAGAARLRAENERLRAENEQLRADNEQLRADLSR